MTCAHRTYPFGTILKVTNPANGKTVKVKVIDRGPFIKGRVIDLSWGAAQALGMLSQGIAIVIVELDNGDIVVPFKPSDDVHLPELDLETTKKDTFKPDWQEMKHR